ncbi:hypothetical protein LBMAG33_1320 [Candidatus Levyibacteriota bacterium]|nr:hypothetical protein LBMAG33_1320 [Candidatus Levybacteria bacterium]
MTVYNTKADVLVNADNPGLMQVSDFYPILKKSIKELQKKYDLEYLLINEEFATLEDIKVKSPKVVFKSNEISVIQLAR